ncbi:uncharacterized protein LOC108094242 [Drosophila ficusphila]|uniref:uncharacterized protein LOC108094242 n=1 Tax=Drosophila ficusphila TaxID=30025 RepID=UPI0007E8AF67|nr:uncharacterized protein LOC108094242 [Drosophila ficusphila]
MPRYYGKYDKKIDYEAVVEAIKQMDKNEKSIRVIAKTYNVPRATLSRYMGKLQDANIDVSTASDDTMITFLKGTTITGAKPIFSDEEEQTLLKYLLHASDIYYGLSISELRALAFQYAVSIKRNYPESWDENKEASKDWYYSFMNRHPNLSLRKPEQVSQNRVKAFTKEKVDAFFDNFRSVLNATNRDVHEKVTTSESSAGASTSGTSSSASLSHKLRQSGPLKKGTPAEKSNRGRKPMRSAILTSPEFVTELREKAAIKRKKEEEAKKTPAPKRRTRSQPARRDSSDDEDVDFCILCLESMPKKLTKNNSVACMECGRDVHAKCATSANTFTCPNCVSD